MGIKAYKESAGIWHNHVAGRDFTTYVKDII
jgi:hypothetical protein